MANSNISLIDIILITDLLISKKSTLAICSDILLEESLGAYFLRVSKSMIVNLKKIKCVRSDISGRMEATLLNDEKIIISRGYVKEIKRRLDL